VKKGASSKLLPFSKYLKNLFFSINVHEDIARKRDYIPWECWKESFNKVL